MADSNLLEPNLLGSFNEVFQNSRFEIIPFASVLNKLQHVPVNSNLTITCSANKSIEDTLDLVKTILDYPTNLKVIPHIAARMVRDESHLDTILSQLKTLSISDIFIPGGDVTPPKGNYHSSEDVIKALANKSHHLTNIGITGYPEGHAILSDSVLWESLVAKSAYANYIVTQMCFDADAIHKWIKQLRQHDINLPVYIGIPGIVERKKLLEISMRIGVGASISFLKKQSGFFKQIFRFKSFQSSTESIISQLLNTQTTENLNIRGFHIYTFNQIKPTFEWWHSLINPKKG